MNLETFKNFTNFKNTFLQTISLSEIHVTEIEYISLSALSTIFTRETGSSRAGSIETCYSARRQINII